MNETETMISEINGFLAVLGEKPLQVASEMSGASELELIRGAREEYTQRLLRKVPKYAKLPPDKIPDLFLEALRSREAELRK